MNQKQETGHLGEKIAKTYLSRRGYTICAERFFARSGEIDIVATHGDTLIFCEVKAVRGLYFGEGHERVNWKKQKRLIQAADWYLLQSGRKERQYRFDVLIVHIQEQKRMARVYHYPNAFSR